MSPEQLARMQAGKEIRRRQRHREAIVRVRAYQRWLADGMPKGRMPKPPRDADYRHAGLTR